MKKKNNEIKAGRDWSIFVDGLNVIDVLIRIDLNLSGIANNFDDCVLLFVGKPIHFIQTNIQQRSASEREKESERLAVETRCLTHFACGR